jgi:hypothetical protein
MEEKRREMDIRSMTPAERWLYAGACVLLPMVWGLAIVWVTNQVERLVARRRNRHPGAAGTRPEPPTLEYHI